jgi:hypothetical protein
MSTAWDFKDRLDYAFPDEHVSLTPRAAKAVQSGKRRCFWVVARVEPVERDWLPELGAAIGRRGALTIAPPEAEHRSIAVTFGMVAKHPMGAISACAYRLDRWLKRSGIEIARISWDTAEDER